MYCASVVGSGVSVLCVLCISGWLWCECTVHWIAFVSSAANAKAVLLRHTTQIVTMKNCLICVSHAPCGDFN